jgi:hypothetical protein
VVHPPWVEALADGEDLPTAPGPPVDVGGPDLPAAGPPEAGAADRTGATAPPISRPWWDDEEPSASPWWEDDDPLGVLTSGAPLLDEPVGDEPPGDEPVGDEPAGDVGGADEEGASAAIGEDADGPGIRAEAASDEPGAGGADPDPAVPGDEGDQQQEVEPGPAAAGRQGGLIRRRRRRRTRRGHRRS